MRRKTDFFTMENRSLEIVTNSLQKHAKLFKDDQHRQELIKRKKEEQAAAANKPKEAEKPKQDEAGATVEEISDEEAKRIEAFEKLRKQQQEAKNAPKKEEKESDEKMEDGEKKEEDSFKQKPNLGNGGETEKYVWNQTLEEVTVFIKLPAGTKANMLDVKIGNEDFKAVFKKDPTNVILEGKWHKKVLKSDCFWNMESGKGAT